MSSDDSDASHVTNVSRRGTKKGKSKLANSQHNLPLDHSDEDLTLTDSLRTESTTRRRNRDDSRSTKSSDGDYDGQEGNLEARFNGSTQELGLANTPLLKSSKASSDSRLDEDEASDSDGLHDVKDNPTDNSPYAQVRASVAATDNTSLSIDTPRMWFLSILFSIAGSSTNLFFSLRYPSVSLTPIIALLLVHPLGLLWDQVFKRSDDPEETFLNGSLQKTSYTSQSSRLRTTWTHRFRLWLAQGRWNEKEHCCVYVSSNVSFGFAFATDVSISDENTCTTLIEARLLLSKSSSTIKILA